MKKLTLFAVGKYLFTILLIAALLFGSAGSFGYDGAWVLLSLFVVFGLLYLFFMVKRRPELYNKRLFAPEQNSTHKWIMRLYTFLRLALLVVAGLCYRFGWLQIPWGRYVVGGIFMLGALVLFVFVLLENDYLTSSIFVEEGQEIISTGPYSVVRHPMYLSLMLGVFALGVILGSYVTVLVII